jgi:hypothetical protein
MENCPLIPVVLVRAPTTASTETKKTSIESSVILVILVMRQQRRAGMALKRWSTSSASAPRKGSVLSVQNFR